MDAPPRAGALTFVVAIAAMTACGPAIPEPSEANGKTTVTVTKGTWEEPPPSGTAKGGAPAATKGPIEEIAPATALDPPPKPALGAPIALVGGSAGEGPLPVPTAIAAAKGSLFAFGRTRGGWVVRIKSTRPAINAADKKLDWSAPLVIASAFDDDAEPAAIGDGDGAWFGVSTTSGASTRIVRVEANGSVLRVAPRADGASGVPSGLGRVAVFVPLKGHVAVIGRSGATAITFARLARTGAFTDAAAKTIAQTTEKAGARSRSPRAVVEDDRVLMTWDGHELAGALESPGTTPEERAAPKPGIYVRRFDGSGEPVSPLRRLTRPGFEAHALDVVVELGACAVLGSTGDGYEMFRIVRKGTEVSPYGGGLHLAPADARDVSLSTDVVGTLAVTSHKLLRIGPGVKIVPTELPFKPPAGGDGEFDVVRVSSDGSGAHVLFGTAGFPAGGVLPTIGRIDGEKMGPLVATPWVGPPPQTLVFAGFEGGEGIALVVDGGKLHAVTIDAGGKPSNVTTLVIEGVSLDALGWARSPVPRLARAGGAWALGLADGRVVILSGAHAGKVLAIGAPPGGVGGVLAMVSNSGKSGQIRAFWIPPSERMTGLSTATIDPVAGAMVEPWAPVPNSERHYGVLGGARTIALARAKGGLYVLANSGPKVTSAAQVFDLVAVGADGALIGTGVDAPSSVQDLELAASTGGAVLLATLGGDGLAARWLDEGSRWKTSFALTPFRLKGEGPVARDKTALVLPDLALPFDPGADVGALIGARCPFVVATGPRALTFACEEGTGSTPLAARAVVRTVTF